MGRQTIVIEAIDGTKRNPLHECPRSKSRKNSMGKTDAEKTLSRFDKGSVVFASAVTATARSEVNTSTFSDLAIFRTESRF